MFGLGYNIKTVEISHTIPWMDHRNHEKKEDFSIKTKMGFIENYKELSQYIKGYATFRHNCPLVTIPKSVHKQYMGWRNDLHEANLEYYERNRIFRKERDDALMVLGGLAIVNTVQQHYLGLVGNACTALTILGDHGPIPPGEGAGAFRVMQECDYSVIPWNIKSKNFEGKSRFLALTYFWDEKYRSPEQQMKRPNLNIVQAIDQNFYDRKRLRKFML